MTVLTADIHPTSSAGTPLKSKALALQLNRMHLLNVQSAGESGCSTAASPDTLAAISDDSYSASDVSTPTTPTRASFSELLNPLTIRYDTLSWTQVSSTHRETIQAVNSNPGTPGLFSIMPNYWSTLVAETPTNGTTTNDVPMVTNFAESANMSPYPCNMIPIVTNGLMNDLPSTTNETATTTTTALSSCIDPKEILPFPASTHSFEPFGVSVDGLSEVDVETAGFDTQGLQGLLADDHSPRSMSAFPAYYEGGHFADLTLPGTPILCDQSGLPSADPSQLSSSSILTGMEFGFESNLMTSSQDLSFSPQASLPHDMATTHYAQETLSEFNLGMANLHAQTPTKSNLIGTSVTDMSSTIRTRSRGANPVNTGLRTGLKKRTLHSTTASGRVGKRMVRSDDRKREWTCTDCQRAFMRSEHLKRHISSVHTDNKPFICRESGCGKQFARSDNLQQHYRTHQRKTTCPSKKQRAANASARTTAHIAKTPASDTSKNTLFVSDN